MGALLGVAIFVFSVTVAASASSSVASDFDVFAATEVQIVGARPGVQPEIDETQARRVRELDGVENAGVVWGVGTLELKSGREPWITSGLQQEVMAISSGAIDFMQPEVTGSGLRTADFDLALPSLLIGRNAIEELPIPPVPQSIVTLGGIPFRIAGIIEGTHRGADAVFNAYISTETADRLFPMDKHDTRVLVEVRPGVASLVADEVRLILASNRPDDLVALYAPEAVNLRQQVTGKLDSLTTLMAVGLLGASVFAIAGTTMAAVIERRNEIGLRRAVGATRSGIVRLILGETTLLALLASLAGVVVALTASLAVEASRGWPPVTPVGLILVAPLSGTVAGLIAGIFPAFHAANIEPSTAMR